MRKLIAPILAIFISLVSVFFAPSAVYAEPAFGDGVDYSRLLSYAVVFPPRIYTAQPGDNLYEIANRFEVPFNVLERDNPQIQNPSLIYPDQIVRIPGKCQVQSGDTLYGIANGFGVPLNQLEYDNPQIQNPNEIYPGEIVYVP
ncbi:MAG: LysM peptidoglycan-binding domain-containing protein [Oscillatoria sp. SIO1A7]|nr:LysM peptidoglycan-binding domain-containing protein [Oscillatoria sp. SIO1A7]